MTEVIRIGYTHIYIYIYRSEDNRLNSSRAQSEHIVPYPTLYPRSVVKRREEVVTWAGTLGSSVF